MQIFRIAILSLVLAFGFFTTSPVNAQVSATAQTTVEVNFPEVLVLYTFSYVDLTLDYTFIRDGIFGASLSACFAGENCTDMGPLAPIAGVTATTDLDIGTPVGTIPLNNVTLTLQNALGARSLGLTDAAYTLGVVDQANSDVLGVHGTQPTSFPNTGLQLSTQSLVLDIDPNNITDQVDSQQVVEVFNITVSGT